MKNSGTRLSLRLPIIIMFSVLAAWTVSPASAQGIQFAEGKTFQQLVDSAKQTGKMLFVDCYTKWCGPCKMMARDVFPSKICGDYINPRFVSAKFDMEEGEGLTIRKQFGVNAYPTMLIINPNTVKEEARMVGGSKAEEFIKKLNETLSGESIASMNERYGKGERDEAFMKIYMDRLAQAYDTKRLSNVVAEYLKGREDLVFTNDTLCNYFIYVTDVNSSAFRYVWKRRAQLEEKRGAYVVRNMERAWMTYPYSKYIDSKHNFALDEAGLNQYLETMKSEGVENPAQIIIDVRLRQAQQAKDYQKLWNLIKNYPKELTLGHAVACNLLKAINEGCTDAKVRKEVSLWAAKRAKALKNEEAKNKKKEGVNAKAVKQQASNNQAGVRQVSFADEYAKFAEMLKK